MWNQDADKVQVFWWHNRHDKGQELCNDVWNPKFLDATSSLHGTLPMQNSVEKLFHLCVDVQGQEVIHLPLLKASAQHTQPHQLGAGTSVREPSSKYWMALQLLDPDIDILANIIFSWNKLGFRVSSCRFKMLQVTLRDHAVTRITGSKVRVPSDSSWRSEKKTNLDRSEPVARPWVVHVNYVWWLRDRVMSIYI